MALNIQHTLSFGLPGMLGGVSSESLQRDEGGMDANYQCTLFKGDNFLKFKCVQITYVTQS